MSPSRHALAIAFSGLAVAGIAAGSAAADVGTGNPLGVNFGKTPRLLPVLHPTAIAEPAGVNYTFRATGSFKVAGKRVARMPAFSGTATPSPRRFTIKLDRTARHAIRAAATNSGSRRTTLTITLRTVREDTGATATYHQDAFLAIPR